MIPSEIVQPRLETRLNLLSRRILVLLGERGSIDLGALGLALGVDADLAALSAGWLARSRVVELNEDSSGRLILNLRRPIE
jgi:hypothetical protein